MTSSGSTLLFGAIPTGLRFTTVEKRVLRQFLELLCQRIGGSRPVVCLLADDAHLRRLNADFLGHDHATDVLSFPAGSMANKMGEMAISIERAAAQAIEFGHSCLDEVRILMLHGTLHLIGLDHENDDGRMAREEKRWRTAFNLPQTLIARASRETRRFAEARKGAA